MPLPKISNYGRYAGDNYGAHTLKVEMCGIEVWFSYQTPVAFSTATTGLVCHQNDWGRTTGKHLNWIADKEQRVSDAEFERLWKEHVEPAVAAVPVPRR